MLAIEYLLLLLVLQTGGLYRGSSVYASFIFFLTIDLAAYFCQRLDYPWVYWILILPGLARILFPLAAPYVRSLFVNCPTKIMWVILIGSVPVGLAHLRQIPMSCPDPGLLELLSFGSCLFAIVLFLIEKSRRQKGIYLFMAQSALCVNGNLLCLVALANSVIWIYFLAFPKVRIFCMSLAALTLFLLVYKP